MPRLRVKVTHTLPQQEARERLIRFVDLLRSSYGNQVSELEQSWEDDTLRFRFKTFGFKLGGSITVTDHELDAQGELPLTALIFRHKIESAIREQLTRLVAS